MKINVVENAKRNVAFGFLNKFITIICPFISRTFLQYTLGEQYLGLNSLFSSILSVLSLSELGFSTAIIYSMYKPVAEGNTKVINALLNFYKKVYCIIGVVILAVGISLIPFLPRLINGGYPEEINLTVLYLVYLGNTVISYFMFAYMSSLTVAYQRDDIVSSTNTIMTLLHTILQITVLYFSHDYFLFLILMPVFTVANNLRIAHIVKKMFPEYRCEGKVPQGLLAGMKKQIAGTFISKVCHIARNSLDSICISAFLGLAITAKYNNYYYLIAAVSSFMAIFVNALTGGIGNHTVIKSKDENYIELKNLDFTYMWISGICTVCILCLSQPFMRLWMGNKMMLPDGIVILLSMYFYLLRIGDIRSIYSNVSGLWWQHRWRSIVEAVANIFLNIILAKFFGVTGIVFATIITMLLIQTAWGSQIVFKYYFGSKYIINYLSYHLKYAVITAVLGCICWFICCIFPLESSVLEIVKRGVICVLVTNIAYYFIYKHTDEFGYAKGIFNERIIRK